MWSAWRTPDMRWVTRTTARFGRGEPADAVEGFDLGFRVEGGGWFIHDEDAVRL